MSFDSAKHKKGRTPQLKALKAPVSKNPRKKNNAHKPPAPEPELSSIIPQPRFLPRAMMYGDGWYEAQVKFEEAMLRLKGSQKADHRIVGSFWEKEWVRAPAEEALTIKQLSTIGADNIVKKRSTTPQKMIALAKVIDKVLGGVPASASLIEEQKIESQSEEESGVDNDSARASAQPLRSVWVERNDLPLFAQGIIAILAEAGVSAASRSDLFSRLISKLPELLNPWQAAVLYCCTEHGEKVSEVLLNTEEKALRQMREEAALMLRRGFERETPELAFFWKQALTTPAVQPEKLLGSLHNPQAVYVSVARMLLYAYGARKEGGGGETALWSSDSKRFRKELMKFKRQTSSDKEQLAKDLQAAFPFVSVEYLLSLIHG
jgi:hypothetical protein